MASFLTRFRMKNTVSPADNLTNDSETQTSSEQKSGGNFKFNSEKPSKSKKESKATLPRKPLAGILKQHTFLILLLFIPLFGIEIYTAINQYQVQRHTVIESHAETARSIAQTVLAFINDQNNSSRALGISFTSGNRLTTAQGNAILAQFRNSDPLINSYRYLDLNGKAIFADPASLVGKDLSNEPRVQNILKGADFEVTGLRPSDLDNKTPVFLVLTPVRATNGALQGILAVSIDTTQLGRVVRVKIGDRGNFSIHDSMGRSVFISTKPNETFEERLQRSTPVPSFIQSALKGNEFLVESTVSRVDNLDRLGASVPIPPIGWVASVSEPVNDALTPVVNLILQRLVLFCLVALLALGAAFFYSRFLVRPLLELKKAAEALGKGNLDSRAPLTSRTAELQQVARSFNQMADQIAQETRSKDAFLAQVSHELKTPLTAIKGFTQIIKRRQEQELPYLENLPPEIAAYLLAQRQVQLKALNSSEHQLDRMTELINRILDLGRIQSGNMVLKKEPFNLFELVERCIEAAAQLTSPERHPISLIKVEPSAGTKGQVVGDMIRTEQIVLNLLENAIKYSPQGGPINLKVQYHAAGELMAAPALELAVEDSGLGLQPDELAHLFDRYYRVDTSDYKISGLGLGLYISHQISLQQNGRLWASSDGPGKGSVFHLALPAALPSRL
ncbi:MAG TPA: sensor histidine kinase [Chloroflexia bacterium]|nr:sensor histidine kinase [Chloroflexia bacterium]